MKSTRQGGGRGDRPADGAVLRSRKKDTKEAPGGMSPPGLSSIIMRSAYAVSIPRFVADRINGCI